MIIESHDWIISDSASQRACKSATITEYGRDIVLSIVLVGERLNQMVSLRIIGIIMDMLELDNWGRRRHDYSGGSIRRSLVLTRTIT